MKIKTKHILDIFHNFSNYELEEFKKFLMSPFLVKVKSLYTLFDEFIKNRDLLLTSEYEKLIIKVSNTLKYSKFMMNKQLSLLSDATLNYLKVKASFADEINSEIILNEYFLKKKNLSVIKNNIDRTNYLLDNADRINEKTFLYYFFNYQNYLNFLTQDIGFTNKQNTKLRFSILNGGLNNFTLYSISNLTCFYIHFFSLNIESGNHKKEIFPINLSIIYEQFDIIQKNVKDKKWKYIYGLYKNLFLTYKNRDNIEHYFEYKKMVEQSEDYMDKELIAFHYNMLINFCVVKERLRENVDFYKKEGVKMLYIYFRNDYFNTYENEYLNATVFRNFILGANSISDFEIIKSFIENNHKKLNPSIRKDMVNYGYAYYYFGIKKYNAALKSIINIEINKFIYKFDLKNIELKLYYEQNRIEFLIEGTRNYREMIIADKVLTKSDKSILLNFINYLIKLVSLRTSIKDKDRIFQAEYYKKTIEKETMVASKKWLIENFNKLSQPENKLDSLK